MERRFRSKRVWLYASFCMPILSLLVAYWGISWGWNTDGLMQFQIAEYVPSSLALFLLPDILLRTSTFDSAFSKLNTKTKIGKSPFLIRGVYIVAISILLTNVFTSSALWLGSMAAFYVGFVLIISGIIQVMAKSNQPRD